MTKERFLFAYLRLRLLLSIQSPRVVQLTVKCHQKVLSIYLSIIYLRGLCLLLQSTVNNQVLVFTFAHSSLWYFASASIRIKRSLCNVGIFQFPRRGVRKDFRQYPNSPFDLNIDLQKFGIFSRASRILPLTFLICNIVKLNVSR